MSVLVYVPVYCVRGARNEKKKSERRDGARLFRRSQRRFPPCHSCALHPVYCFSFFFPSLNNDRRNKRHPVPWTIGTVVRVNPPPLSAHYLDRRSRMATFIRRARFPVRRRYSEFHFILLLRAFSGVWRRRAIFSCRELLNYRVRRSVYWLLPMRVINNRSLIAREWSPLHGSDLPFLALVWSKRNHLAPKWTVSGCRQIIGVYMVSARTSFGAIGAAMFNFRSLPFLHELITIFNKIIW